MARAGYFILDSDLHLMEPYDLWERYLEGPHKARPPHFFAAYRRPEEEIKVVGVEVQGLAIPAHGRSPGAIASSRELRRRSRARHAHFEVAQAQGFDAASTLTAMDDAARRKILWDNCARLYDIPKPATPLTRAAPAAAAAQ